MLRNVASQKYRVYAWDATTGLPKTGDAANITAKINKDDAGAATTNDANPTEVDSTNEKGFYDFDLTQAESNAAKVSLSPKSSTANVVVMACPPVVYTVPQYSSLEAINSSGKTAATLAAADVSGNLPADLKQANGVDVYNEEFTVASATSSTITLPSANSDGSTLPNDASHAGKVVKVVAGTGVGQILILTSRVGSTREWNVLGMTTQLDNTSKCETIDTWKADTRYWVGADLTATENAIPAIIAPNRTTGNIPADVKSLNGGAAPVHTDGKLWVLDSGGNAVATQSIATAIKAKTDNLPVDPIQHTEGVIWTLDGTGAALATSAQASGIATVTDKLADTLENNAGTYRFTSASLAQAPTGSAPSAADIADAVLDEAVSGHTTPGSLGAVVAGTATDAANAATNASIAAGNAADTLSEIGAVRAKTDNLTFTNAGKVDATTAAIANGVIADAAFAASNETAAPTGPVSILYWLGARFSGTRKVVRDILNGNIKVFRANGSTVWTSSSYTVVDDVSETINPPS